MADETPAGAVATFRCNIAPLQRAVKRSGTGGARIQIDVPEIWCAEAEPFFDWIDGCKIEVAARLLEQTVFGASGSSTAEDQIADQDEDAEPDDNSVCFICQIALIKTAISKSGTGDGSRVQLDVEESQYQIAKPFLAQVPGGEIEITARKIESGNGKARAISRRKAGRGNS